LKWILCKAHFRWGSKVQIPRNQFGLIWSKLNPWVEPCLWTCLKQIESLRWTMFLDSFEANWILELNHVLGLIWSNLNPWVEPCLWSHLKQIESLRWTMSLDSFEANWILEMNHVFGLIWSKLNPWVEPCLWTHLKQIESLSWTMSWSLAFHLCSPNHELSFELFFFFFGVRTDWFSL
jgi:hypothetical protein